MCVRAYCCCCRGCCCCWRGRLSSCRPAGELGSSPRLRLRRSLKATMIIHGERRRLSLPWSLFLSPLAGGGREGAAVVLAWLAAGLLVEGPAAPRPEIRVAWALLWQGVGPGSSVCSYVGGGGAGSLSCSVSDVAAVATAAVRLGCGCRRCCFCCCGISPFGCIGRCTVEGEGPRRPWRLVGARLGGGGGGGSGCDRGGTGRGSWRCHYRGLPRNRAPK